jgi:hypothetical protein
MSTQPNSSRTYTLTEARAVLPEVKRLMARIQQARARILELRPSAWSALQKAAANGGSREAGALALEARALEESVKAILALGLLIKDLDHGILDFWGTRAGTAVFLCWRIGEDDITFWHAPEAGFAGRRPIDALVD